MLFKVNKSICSDQQDQVLYVSLPIIATFNIQNISTVVIELPHIENCLDAQRFESTLNYQVIDAKGSNLPPIRHDVLTPLQGEFQYRPGKDHVKLQSLGIVQLRCQPLRKLLLPR